MAVQTSDAYVSYAADGMATTYAIPFLLIKESDLSVELDDLPVSYGYTITGVGQNTGQITFTTPPAGQLLLERNVPLERLTDYQTNGDLLAHTVNLDFDRVWCALQDLLRGYGRSLIRPFFKSYFDAGDYRIANLADPIADQDAVTNAYLQNLISGLIAQGQGPISSAANVNFIDPAGTTRNLQQLSKFEQELPGTGSQLVGYLYETLYSRLRRTVHASIYGASPSKSAAFNTAAIQAAIDSMHPYGGELIFDAMYPVAKSPAGNYCLRITDNVSLIGRGMYYGIDPAGVASNVVPILIKPSPETAYNAVSLDGIRVGQISTANRSGGIGILLDTQDAGSYASKFNIRRCFVNLGNDVAFQHINNPANNPNGGLYCSVIQDSSFRGGVRFDNSGDSNGIERCILTGPGLGLYFSAVAGASQFWALNNNITSEGGAICIDAGRRVQIRGNNIEQTVVLGGANGGAMINARGGNGTMAHVWIEKNNMGSFQNNGIASHIFVDNCMSGHARNNQMIAGGAITNSGVHVGATAVGFYVGPNQYGATVTPKVNDQGISTQGVTKTLTLQNGWTAYNPTYYASATCEKDEDGSVSISGAIKGGTLSPGTTILFTLPVGFRPVQVEVFTITMLTSTGFANACVSINPDGTCLVNSGNVLGMFLGGIKFRAAGGGDSASEL